MKKSHLLILLVTFISINLSAQTYFGFKVGANFANFVGDVENNAIKPSFHVGGVAEIQITDVFSVQPEILFSMQGYQDKDDSLIKYNYHYVNVPLMVKYFVGENVSIDAGPQVGLLLYSKRSNGHEDLDDLKDASNSFDYGMNLGASYEMNNGIFMSARYYYGLANVLNTDDNLKANNTVIQISLGYKFY
jgi:hypothetical protein